MGLYIKRTFTSPCFEIGFLFGIHVKEKKLDFNLFKAIKKRNPLCCLILLGKRKNSQIPLSFEVIFLFWDACYKEKWNPLLFESFGLKKNIQIPLSFEVIFLFWDAC